MSLTRKGCKAMGLTDEQVDSIIEAHTETVEALKEKLKTAQADADKLTEVQKELDALKAKSDDGYKEKYETLKKEFDAYKTEVTAKETKAAKEAAAKAYFEGKNITGVNLEIAMRAAAQEIDALELDGDKIKDSTALDALTSGTLAGLAAKKAVVGAQTAHPPAQSTPPKRTMEEIMKIKDTTERQSAIGELLKERMSNNG